MGLDEKKLTAWVVLLCDLAKPISNMPRALICSVCLSELASVLPLYSTMLSSQAFSLAIASYTHTDTFKHVT